MTAPREGSLPDLRSFSFLALEVRQHRLVCDYQKDYVAISGKIYDFLGLVFGF